MKTVLKITGGIVLGFAVLGVIGIVLIGQCVPAPPETATPSPELPPPPTKEKPEGKLITDLAYITAYGLGYSDDADPEYEGVQIYFQWNNSKSEYIHFRNIPMLVTIELFTSKINVETLKYEPIRCVYKGQAEIDSSSSYIRIPFEHIKADPNIDDNKGILKVGVHTPKQGDFSLEGYVWALYEKPKE